MAIFFYNKTRKNTQHSKSYLSFCPDIDEHVSSDLDLNHLTLKVFLKEFFKKLFFYTVLCQNLRVQSLLQC